MRRSSSWTSAKSYRSIGVAVNQNRSGDLRIFCDQAGSIRSAVAFGDQRTTIKALPCELIDDEMEPSLKR